MSVERFPEQLNVRLPLGWRDRIEALAAAAVQSPVAWMGALIRRTLESAERAERRRKAAS